MENHARVDVRSRPKGPITMMLLAQTHGSEWNDLLPLLGAVAGFAAYIGAIRLWYHKLRMECVDAMSKDQDESTQAAAQWSAFKAQWGALAQQAEALKKSADQVQTDIEKIKPETDERHAALAAAKKTAKAAEAIEKDASTNAKAKPPESHMAGRLKTAVNWIRALSLLDVAILFTAIVVFKQAFRQWLPYVDDQWTWDPDAPFDPFALAVQLVLLLIVAICFAHVASGFDAWAMSKEFKPKKQGEEKKHISAPAIIFVVTAGLILLVGLLFL
jgi:hypothetical protein